MIDLGVALRDTVREVVREEIRAALKEFGAGGNLGAESLLTYRQAAEFAGVCLTTIHAWRKAGILTVHGQGRVRRIDRADLRRAMDAPLPPAEISVDERVKQLLEKRSRRRGR